MLLKMNRILRNPLFIMQMLLIHLRPNRSQFHQEIPDAEEGRVLDHMRRRKSVVETGTIVETEMGKKMTV